MTTTDCFRPLSFLNPDLLFFVNQDCPTFAFNAVTAVTLLTCTNGSRRTQSVRPDVVVNALSTLSKTSSDDPDPIHYKPISFRSLINSRAINSGLVFLSPSVQINQFINQSIVVVFILSIKQF
jgi:hypothetical protein